MLLVARLLLDIVRAPLLLHHMMHGAVDAADVCSNVVQATYL
jgi:hypothetical protein